MFYSIRHLTKFRYSTSVTESLMELRMHPRSEGLQRCLKFQVTVTPRTRVQSYRDYMANVVHHFDVPGAHRLLTIIAESMVDVTPRETLPGNLGEDAWEQLDAKLAGGDFWEVLAPSRFAQWTDLIEDFAQEYLHGDLRDVRDTMLWKLDGLGEYDARRPLTYTGTNLVGLIKHLSITEAWYFGEVSGRPFPERLPSDRRRRRARRPRQARGAVRTRIAARRHVGD